MQVGGGGKIRRWRISLLRRRTDGLFWR